MKVIIIFRKQLIILLTLVIFLSLPSYFFHTFASFPNSAYTIPLKENIPIGSIIVETTEGYVQSSGKNDEHFVGILVDQADFVYRAEEEKKGLPISAAGILPVLLKNSSGQIVKGDAITFSKTDAGIGVKAQEGDIILGTAEQTVNGETIQIKPVEINTNIGERLKQSPKDNSILARELANLVKQTSNKIAHGHTNPALYLLAIIIIILAAVCGFVLFGRISINGITAIGRNPLAKNAIMHGIVINTLMIIALILGSIFAAAYIIR